MSLLAIRLWVHWTSKWVLLIEWLGQCLSTSPDIVIEQNLSVRSFTPMCIPGSNSRPSVAIYFTSSELVRDNIQYYNFLVDIFAPALIYIEYIASICTWGTTPGTTPEHIVIWKNVLVVLSMRAYAVWSGRRSILILLLASISVRLPFLNK